MNVDVTFYRPVWGEKVFGMTVHNSSLFRETVYHFFLAYLPESHRCKSVVLYEMAVRSCDLSCRLTFSVCDVKAFSDMSHF